jgi:hypothetical protein
MHRVTTRYDGYHILGVFEILSASAHYSESAGALTSLRWPMKRNNLSLRARYQQPRATRMAMRQQRRVSGSTWLRMCMSGASTAGFFMVKRLHANGHHSDFLMWK